jgi:addiction module RelE/StbE family toxin
VKYTLLATRIYDKSLHNVAPHVRNHIEQAVFVLEETPRAGHPLRQALKGLWSLHLKFENTHYRVIYTIDDTQHIITLRYVGSRENIYKQVQRLSRNAA